ncbi:RING-type domain-containing protein [Phanerochaete sordida]|uniref:RING-type domain-containing protein n=1 Tax=Phanerochaete sordida TaxID=48140 RepID=A0A9P3FYU6_9APHY|nr:RING-type domain-containing protein [Phanerochaete sordida]
MMFRSTASSQQMVAPGSGRSDPNRIAPYLTHLETHHGQLTLIPPQNAGRTRKSGKRNPEKPRPERRREPDEPRFNMAAPTTPRGASRRGNTSAGRAARVPVPPPNAVRDSMIPDYPPPSFQEALMTPPFVPPPLSETSAGGPQQDAPEGDPTPDTSSPPPVDQPEPLSPAAAPTQPPSLTVQTAVGPSGSPSSSPSSQPNSDQYGSSGSGSDESSNRTSSLEIVGYDTVTDGWDADRRRGVPLGERIMHERRRLLIAESTTNLSLGHTTQPGHAEASEHCTHCGSPKPGSISGHQLPLPDPVDFMEQVPDGLTPPSSPKSTKKSWKKLLHPIVPHDGKGSHDPTSPLSPEPRSPTAGTFGFLQGAWASTLTLASTSGGSPSKPSENPSPSSVKRRESSGIRRLFGSKGKERDLSPAAPAAADDEPWEVVNRASVIWAEEQERKGSSRSISPISEVSLDRDYISSPAASPRSARKQSLASPVTTPFINRPIRHATMNGSNLTLPLNQSVVSLQIAAGSGPSVGRPSPTSESGLLDTHGQKKSKRTPPPPPPPRRKAVSTTMPTSPSTVWLPFIDTQAATSARTYAEVASPTQTLASPATATTTAAPYNVPRSYPSLPTLRPSSREGAEGTHSLPSPPPSAGLYGSFTAPPGFAQEFDAISIASSPAAMTSIPVTRPSAGKSRIPPPVVTITDSMSTISLDSPSITPPRTPTTPTHPHHYPGRPLPLPPRPQPPRQLQPIALPARQPSPLRTTAAVASPVFPAVSPISEHPHATDLDVLAARVIEGDHSGRNYEDLLHISEFAGPALNIAASQDPFLIDATTLKVPPSGRVRLERRRTMKDGRIKLKLTLLGEHVDKCGICLSQFKDAEVACLGTHCQHAFHEYCLKRWLVRSRACPLCRLTI